MENGSIINNTLFSDNPKLNVVNWDKELNSDISKASFFVLVISHHWPTVYETLSHLLDSQQWHSFGCKLSSKASFVAMEVIVGVD
jgi:hypothetical protein